MEKRNDLFDNDYSEYFDLFQQQTDYSSKILEEAKRIKQSIRKIYEDIDFLDHKIDPNAWAFDFDIILTQVSEQPEPDALKLFTRQYTPVVRIYQNSNLKSTVKFYEETKYIHKHINELFVGENVSQEYFFDVAQQYFLLDFVYKLLRNGMFSLDLVSKIKESCNEYDEKQETIICVNCKLRGRNMPEKINPNLHSVISHINTLWHNLSKQSNFTIIGNYKNYLNENELIKLLNNEEHKFVSETISDYFQNDCLLLNNIEFLYENPYTIDWNSRIFSPLLLKNEDDKYCLIDKNELEELNKQIFLFQKIKPDGMFYKTEIYIPSKTITEEYFNKIISLSMSLLSLKQQEEK